MPIQKVINPIHEWAILYKTKFEPKDEEDSDSQENFLNDKTLLSEEDI